jgi:hypothetical protein
MFQRAGIAVVIVGVVVVLASAGKGSSSLPEGMTGSLPEGMTGPGPSTSIEPAPPRLEPRITEADALRIAWREEGRNDATSVRSELALLRVADQGRTQSRLCGSSRMKASASERMAPLRGATVGCSTWGVMIDAMTGEFLVAGV